MYSVVFFVENLRERQEFFLYAVYNLLLSAAIVK